MYTSHICWFTSHFLFVICCTGVLWIRALYRNFYFSGSRLDQSIKPRRRFNGVFSQMFHTIYRGYFFALKARSLNLSSILLEIPKVVLYGLTKFQVVMVEIVKHKWLQLVPRSLFSLSNENGIEVYSDAKICAMHLLYKNETTSI